MKKPKAGEVKRGQTISFRVPSDTPDHVLKHLQRLKETERRNFSSKIADFVMQGVGNSYARERETITIPLPHKLSKSQRDWLKHEHSEALIGNIIYQLLSDPVRSTILLASFNSNTLDIDEALYLQEEIAINDNMVATVQGNSDFSEDGTSLAAELDAMDDDLSNLDWDEAKEKQPRILEEANEEIENDLEDLLGDFLAKMNK
ncbi:hypothetical protein [Bacillus sp. T33-2]|uniref:hypothetical protein n=1 Tax=Bacillus sp. T33-2 TaxID=2054168 RepID=UPI000C76F4D5|nr:hypothetical protein [Bacillus sp. T33-2]PLR96498.1 hypothetical protein CVD19_10905 [Bacillus sp. T33-2]